MKTTKSFNNTIFYLNETTFNKKMKSLKKYCPIAYKELIFNLKNQILIEQDGVYTKKLKTSKEFKFIYGQIELDYIVRNGSATILEINPSHFFMDGYISELKTYKGFFYRNDYDKFKIDLLISMR